MSSPVSKHTSNMVASRRARVIAAASVDVIQLAILRAEFNDRYKLIGLTWVLSFSFTVMT